VGLLQRKTVDVNRTFRCTARAATAAAIRARIRDAADGYQA
jgi:hypothetical protein